MNLTHQLDQEKTLAAFQAAQLVEDGMVLGLGSGSTAARVIQALGERIAKGLQVKGGVPSSKETFILARQSNIPLLSMEKAIELGGIDLTLDGTDEFDAQLNLIKGGGGALLREKLLASASRRMVIVADSSKQVRQLGAFPLPIEVAAFGWQQTAESLANMGIPFQLRTANDHAWTTENGGYILDCSLGVISNPSQLEAKLRTVLGVMENGLFCGLAQMVLMGSGDKVVEFTSASSNG